MKNKYNAVKYVEDGITFDSKKEAKRYLQLKEMADNNEIQNLQCQVKFELQGKYENGKNEKIRSLSYIADFTYVKDNVQIIEDTKGVLTDVFKMKRKLFEKIYYPLTIDII